jgi:hypothetical protein
MRKRATAIVFLCSLAGASWAQSGAEITMPRNWSQEEVFTFANSCPTREMFQVSAQPHVEWLKMDSKPITAGPDTSFNIHVTIDTSSNKLGKYRASVMVICATCALIGQECLQPAKEVPLSLTVANVDRPALELTADTPPAPPPQVSGAKKEKPMPALVMPVDPPRARRLRYLPLVGLGVLLLGSIGLLLAVLALTGAGRGVRLSNGEMRAESERHQVRR